MKKLFFDTINCLNNKWNNDPIVINNETKKENLIKLAEEGFNNFSLYPDDKMFRWLGYLHGVMLYYNILLISKINFDEFIRKELENEKFVLENIVLKRYINNYNDEADKSLISDVLKTDNILNKHYLLGKYQGFKIAKGEMDVLKERNFTRPYFHSYREENVKTFG